MTQKESYEDLIFSFAKEFNIELKDAEIQINFLAAKIANNTIANGKCAFGKVGSFNLKIIRAKPEKLNVTNTLPGKSDYNIPAKPERKSIKFSLSSYGKTISD